MTRERSDFFGQKATTAKGMYRSRIAMVMAEAEWKQSKDVGKWSPLAKRHYQCDLYVLSQKLSCWRYVSERRT